MDIKTVNHSDRYSVEQICSLYFLPEEEAFVASVFDEKNKKIITEVTYKEKSATAECVIFGSEKADFKNAVKKSALNAFSKISNAPVPWGILTGIRPTKFFRTLVKEHSVSEAEKILLNDYFVREDKVQLVRETAMASSTLLSRIGKNDIGIYLGVPFCPTRCAYCSFITEAASIYKKYSSEYADALEKEAAAMASAAKSLNLNVKSVYIGGGTPPTLGESRLERLIESVQTSFDLTPNTELTVEAGRPDATDYSMLKMLSRRGVNRICINPQTMNDETLKKIGRRHSSEDTKRTFLNAREIGFDNINSDIIAGLPGEDEAMMANTLSEINLLSPEEITVHTMYVKRAAAIKNDGSLTEDSEKVSRRVNNMIDLTRRFARDNGYASYYMYKQRNTLGNLENTGYAKKGKESLYNVCIMEEENTVIGCGAGASTKAVKDNINRIYNTKDVLLYIKNIDEMIENKRAALEKFLG